MDNHSVEIEFGNIDGNEQGLFLICGYTNYVQSSSYAPESARSDGDDTVYIELLDEDG